MAQKDSCCASKVATDVTISTEITESCRPPAKKSSEQCCPPKQELNHPALKVQGFEPGLKVPNRV